MCEAKPKNIQTDGYDQKKSKPKLNGEGGFNDYTIERLKKDIKENLNLLSIEVGQLMDSAMTYWSEMGIDTLDRDGEIQNLIDNLIKPINEGFATKFADGNYKVDSAEVVGKNSYAVTLDGYKSAFDVGVVKVSSNNKNMSYVFQNNLNAEIPDKFSLQQNYPNPFNPTTTISFSLVDNEFVSLKIYDILGREIKTLINNEEMESGFYEIDFDANNLNSGIYFYKLTTNNFSEMKKMILVK